MKTPTNASASSRRWTNSDASRLAKSGLYAVFAAAWTCAAWQQVSEVFVGSEQDIIVRIARSSPQWGLALVAAIWAFSLGLVITLALQDAHRSRQEKEFLANSPEEEGEDEEDLEEDGMPGRWLVH